MNPFYETNTSNNTPTNDSFLDSKNLKMIWDIVYDDVLNKVNFKEETSYNLHKDFYNTSQIYLQSIPNNENVPLMVLNKNYIIYFLNKIYPKQWSSNNIPKAAEKWLYPKQLSSNNISKPGEESYFNETSKNHTNEAITNQRIKIFEDELSKKEDEFLNSFKKEMPSVPDFKLKMDHPLKDTDSLLKQMAKQRNYDMTMFNNKEASINLDTKNLLENQDNITITEVSNPTIEKNDSVKKIKWEDEIIDIDHAVNNQNSNISNIKMTRLEDHLKKIEDKIDNLNELMQTFISKSQ